MGKSDETWEAESSPASVEDLTDALWSLQLKKGPVSSGQNQESFDSPSKDVSSDNEAEVNGVAKPSVSAKKPPPPSLSDDKQSDAAENEGRATTDSEPSTANGEESDEDNENVIFEDNPPSQTGAVKKEPYAQKLEDEEYQERGPCKVSRSHYSGSRYNPMDDLSYDASPPQFTTDMVVPDLLNLNPGHDPALYSSPIYAGYNSPAAADLGDYSPAPATVPSYGYGSMGGSEMQAAQYGGWDGNYTTDSSCSPFTHTPNLSTSYLDAIEEAVADTVDDSSGDLTSSGSEDGDDKTDQNIRLIIDSLRSIDPNELDYIAPASPAAALLDLEQELALSSEQWPDRCSSFLTPSPPLTPTSPSLPDTPPSPGFSPPSSPQDYKESRNVKDVESSCRATVAAVRELCNPEVILRAAKSVYWCVVVSVYWCVAVPVYWCVVVSVYWCVAVPVYWCVAVPVYWRVASQNPNDLCYKDRDGDTCYMIVVCKPSDSEHFYENMFVLQQHLQKLRLCCDRLLDADVLACPICGASRADWRSLLSETNNAGDTVLSCAVKMRHPELVIDYLCAGLAGCKEDLRRVFDDAGRKFFQPYARIYPGLKRFL
ncbi:hypothetical protein FHG87_008896 [Trinorchestia longiramus]|nr:hypothetical protein FHG87_008896 [Trinorchestia longiramus]